MIFGDKNVYAIQVYHQPIDNKAFFMTGCMCIFLNNKKLGDIDIEYCHFGPTYCALSDKVNYINELEYEFNLNNDYEIFNFLDNKLYIGDEDDRPSDEIITDWKKYERFDFLTRGGEPFDGTTSFIYMDKNQNIHIMYKTGYVDEETYMKSEINCIIIDKETFVEITNDYIRWYLYINGK
jgi:hypothetical protein